MPAGRTFAPESRGRKPEGDGRRHLGTTRSQKVERRALWVVQRWADDPSVRPGAMKLEVQARFECGITASDQALSRAYELMAEHRNDGGLVDRIAGFYFELAKDARRDKQFNSARMAMDSLRAHLGIGAPERVEHSGGVSVEVEQAIADLTDDELALLARLEK